MADPFYAASGYNAAAGRNAHEAGRPTVFAMPSLLRSLLTDHLDPGYAAAAAAKADRTPSRPARVRGWGWQVLAALLVAALFAIAAAQARTLAPDEHNARRLLAANVRVAQRSTDALTAERDSTARRVDDLRRDRLANDAEGRQLLADLDRLSLAAGTTALRGPGLAVTVTDPGVGPNLSDASKQRVSGSRQIILDRDLQLAVNSLWAAGAEAVAVGGVRIGPNVTIRQAGGAILVDNTAIGSPYRIVALGAAQEMRKSFDRSPGLVRLRLLETGYGVGVRVDAENDLTVPAGVVRDTSHAERLPAP